jgi:hypothetical protein
LGEGDDAPNAACKWDVLADNDCQLVEKTNHKKCAGKLPTGSIPADKVKNPSRCDKVIPSGD